MSVSHVRSEKVVDACDITVGDEINLFGDWNTVVRVVAEKKIVTVVMGMPESGNMSEIYDYAEPVTVRRMVPVKSVSTDSPRLPEGYIVTPDVVVGELWTDTYQGYVSFDAGWFPVVPSDLSIGSVFVTEIPDSPGKFDMYVCSGPSEKYSDGWIIPTFAGPVADCAGMVYARA